MGEHITTQMDVYRRAMIKAAEIEEAKRKAFDPAYAQQEKISQLENQNKQQQELLTKMMAEMTEMKKSLDTDVFKILRNKINTLISEKGIVQKEIAESLDKVQPYISQLLNGKVENLEDLKSIEKFCSEYKTQKNA